MLSTAGKDNRGMSSKTASSQSLCQIKFKNKNTLKLLQRNKKPTRLMNRITCTRNTSEMVGVIMATDLIVNKRLVIHRTLILISLG